MSYIDIDLNEFIDGGKIKAKEVKTSTPNPSPSSILNDMFHASEVIAPTEENQELLKNMILTPISKAFMEKYPQYDDAIVSYEHAVEQIPTMLETDPDSTLDTTLDIDDQRLINIKYRLINVRLFGPNTADACKFNPVENMLTPNQALANRATYCLTIVGDVEAKFLIMNKQKENKNKPYIEVLNEYSERMAQAQYTTFIFKDGMVTWIPLMIGSKWCALRNFDYSTLIRTGEEFRAFYGYFIVEGKIRHLVPAFKKPINKALVLHNEHDEQLSRVEIQYSRGMDYENSYFMVGSMIKEPKKIKSSSGNIHVPCHDFGFSLQFEHKSMNRLDKTGKGIKKLINFVPIKILFAAFGCTTDEELINYICPARDDFGLISAIKMAVLYGQKHVAAYNKAGIKLKPTDGNYIKLAEPLTPLLAKYIIGCLMLKEETLINLNKKSAGSIEQYRALVATRVDGIFKDRFMPGIGDTSIGSNVDRDVAICMTLGMITAELYLVGMNLHESQAKQSLINKRLRYCLQLSKEFKSFWGIRLKQDLVMYIVKFALPSIDREDFAEILRNKLEAKSKDIGIDQAKSLLQSFKGSAQQESKIRNEVIEPKNQVFIWNKLREIAKSSDLGKRNVNEAWPNRRPHPSELFFLCPTSTSESANVAKFRSLTIHTRITITTPAKPIIEFLQKYPHFQRTIDHKEIRSLYVVSVNGSISGYVKEFEPVEKLFHDIMEVRRQGILIDYNDPEAKHNVNNTIPCDCSIVLNNFSGKLDIWCDVGRLVTPFVIIANAFDISNEVKPKKEFINWLKRCNEETGAFDEGILKGYIEFADAEMLAVNDVVADCARTFYDNPRKFTHMAMNHSIDCIVIAANGFSSINQGVRSCMASNHLKQAMGSPASKYPMLKFMNNYDMLIAPQQILVQPPEYRHMSLNDFPIGVNCPIAFMQYKYNQDDAIIFNERWVQQGMLKCDTETTYLAESMKNDERFAVPNPEEVKKLTGNPFSYEKIGESSCLPKEISTTFNQGDVILTKVKDAGTGVADCSITNKMPDASNTANPRPVRCIEKHYVHEQSQTQKLLMTGQFRVCIPGDKVNAEHMQKNTIGRLLHASRVPYTSTGMRPAIIFNPKSILKRKTYGMLFYSVIAKIAALNGIILESSTYGEIRTAEDITRLLRAIGIDERGFERMYDPETGEEIEGGVFVGMGYYERQHHLLESKINVRCKGQMDPITGMPVKGRSKQGGTSFDRLTTDTLFSSGANYLNLDMHLNQCSKMEVGFCQLCHSVMCYRIGQHGEWKCPRCGFHPNIEVRWVSKSFPLLMNILIGLHVLPEYIGQVDPRTHIKTLPSGDKL